MVRRCKSYLSALQVVDNEFELDAASFEIEPQSNCGISTLLSAVLCLLRTKFLGASQTQSRRPLPSPSISSCSSLSVNSDKNRRATGPKFGKYIILTVFK